jgi:hypothetical protein
MCFLGLALSTEAFAGGDSGYGIVARWPVAGAGKWDYLIVDSVRHRLFVSRRHMSRCSGIALDAPRHRLFSVCHNERLIVTDSVTGTRVAELPIGKHVDAVAFDPFTSLVFSSNGDSADVTVSSSLFVIAQERRRGGTHTSKN